jgi:DNA excision repair protein ERCC-4
LDLSIIRKLEIFKNNSKDSNLRIYSMFYNNSSEEQLFIHSISNERENFKKLIFLKSKIIFPDLKNLIFNLKINQNLFIKKIDNNDDENLKLINDKIDENLQIKNDKNDENLKLKNDKNDDEIKFIPIERKTILKKVIIDVREFRSSLPSLLDKNNYIIIPITLKVGDYILTKDICIERKSLQDLEGSLKSGRLFTQSTNMQKYYKHFGVLIHYNQFDQFQLISDQYLNTDYIQHHLMSNKLILLQIHFPRLKLFWSPNQSFAVDLFNNLKLGYFFLIF